MNIPSFLFPASFIGTPEEFLLDRGNTRLTEIFGPEILDMIRDEVNHFTALHGTYQQAIPEKPEVIPKLTLAVEGFNRGIHEYKKGVAKALNSIAELKEQIRTRDLSHLSVGMIEFINKEIDGLEAGVYILNPTSFRNKANSWSNFVIEIDSINKVIKEVECITVADAVLLPKGYIQLVRSLYRYTQVLKHDIGALTSYSDLPNERVIKQSINSCLQNLKSLTR